MEEFAPLYKICSILFLILAIKLFLKNTKNQHKNLPPSPPSLPIIGHLHLFVKEPNIHRTLHNLSKKYGQIMSFRIGTRLALVISSHSIAGECLNNINFSQRPQISLGKHLKYHSTFRAFSNNDDNWRSFRRISNLELFSPSSLNKFTSIRQEEVNLMLCKLHLVSCNDFVKVELRSMFLQLTTNIISRMVAGNRYSDEEDQKENSGIRSFFSYMPWLDLGKYMKGIVDRAERMDSFVQGLIDEHRMNKNGDQNSFIGYLLHLQESQTEDCSDEFTKGLILSMFFAGVETTQAILEWGMANLLNHPTVLQKLKEEMDTIIGEDRLINEMDISKLKYLQNVILETFRLYPTAPLLVPRSSSTDCTVEGFHVPANTMLFVNIWSIHRNPNTWDDPTSFKPERFEKFGNDEVEKFKLLAFGYGRRSCPGENLANKIISLTLGSLIQCFDWERVDGKEIDMTEKILISMGKAKPLVVMCKARPIVGNVSLFGC